MRLLAFTFVAFMCLPSGVALSGDLYIVNGMVHSVSSPPQIATVVIRGEHIAAVDPLVEPGVNDEIIDADGMIVTPGLVAFDSQLGLVEIWAVDQSRDGDAGTSDPIRAAFRAADAVNPQSVLVPITRCEGVTSVLSHPSGGLISGQSVWLDLAGDTTDEMIAISPATMHISGGAAAGGSIGQSRAAALMRLRELFTDIATYRENPNAYQAGRMRDLSVSLLDMEAIIPVLDGDIPVFLRANRRADIISALTLVDDYGIDIIIGEGDEAWAIADELASRSIPVVVNPLRNIPSSFESLGARADNAAILDRAGVPVIITTQSSHNARLVRQHVGNAIRAGLHYESALAAVTLRPAEAVGVDDRYGSIDVGKVANIVVWSGDPFELSTHVRAVIIRGDQIPLENRQTRLFQRYRELEIGRNSLGAGGEQL